MQKTDFKELKDQQDLHELSELAVKVWNSYYPPIIGQQQVDYMLDKFYSIDSLLEQINEKEHTFIGAYIDKVMIGFISFNMTGDDEYFIHKLYVDTGIHGKGIGKALFDHVFSGKKFDAIRLTVNRQNIGAINFYFKKGFIIEKVTDIDIGNGFFMNDFIMVLKPGKQI